MNARLAWAMARYNARKVAAKKTNAGKRRQVCRWVAAIKQAMKAGRE